MSWLQIVAIFCLNKLFRILKRLKFALCSDRCEPKNGDYLSRNLLDDKRFFVAMEEKIVE